MNDEIRQSEGSVPPPLLIRGGRVIDPAAGLDGCADVLLAGGRVVAVSPHISDGQVPPGARLVRASGLVVCPGFIDLHVHLREPGHEYKEDIASGTRAAAAGGFTTVCCMPNTTPPNDCRAVTELVLRRAAEVGVVRVRPIGAISQGLRGEALAEMAELKEAGVVAFSDDGRPVMNAELMRRAMEYARMLGLPLVQHAEDLSLSAGGVMNEGPAATRAGLRGQPACAESVMVLRDLELCALTGARYHVAHISTAASVRAVREAKRAGLPVSCEVTPHHLTLTDAACCSYDTATKVAPPLRSEADVAALKEGLADGTIDCFATDHAPHAPQDKQVEFDRAAFGMIGLETALPLLLRLVEERVISLPDMIARLTSRPATLFGLPGGSLRPGSPADVTVLDLQRVWTVDGTTIRSKSRNTPFVGWQVRGRAVLTVCRGEVVHDEMGPLPTAPPAPR
ncbi:MAG: dihydroorotase [Myxococcales bacterium]|nr:dihydroorotase [Myxococcota bacterium]MDW8280477.1 dihydroorotase [Myxococcales bacterium]